MFKKIFQKEVKVSNIYKITHNFRENIQSIQVFVEVIGKLADEHDNNVINDCFNPLEETYKKLKTEFFSSIKKDENEEDSLSEAEKQELMKYWVNKISMKEVMKNLKKMTKSAPRQGELLRKNSLITLLSTFENLISNLIQEYYTQFPTALPSDTKKLTLAEIKELGSIEEAEKSIMDSEIDSILRGDISSQLDYCSKKLTLKLNYISEYKDYLVEVAQRRNILVHNDGIINKHYLKKIDNKLFSEELIEGKKIQVSSEYLLERIELIYITGIILIQESFRKWTKKYDECNSILTDIIFESLQEKKYSFVEKLSKYIHSIKFDNEKDYKVLIINHCLALKRQDKIDKMKEELNKHDWSAVSNEFKLALAILKNEDEKVYKELNNSIMTNIIDEDSLESWPLFEEYRDQDKFKEILQSFKDK